MGVNPDRSWERTRFPPPWRTGNLGFGGGHSDNSKDADPITKASSAPDYNKNRVSLK